MTRFFDSEEVRKSIHELDSLQEKIFNDLYMIPFYNKSEKEEYLELMQEFLEKQKLFVFRLSLSDDPEAVELKEKIIGTAKILGMNNNETVNDFFDRMEKTLNDLKKSLDI